MALRKRVEVLFDEEKFTYLEQLALREKTSVGHLIREAVEKTYLGAGHENRRDAVRWLTTQGFDFGEDWEGLKYGLASERHRQALKSLDEDALR